MPETKVRIRAEGGASAAAEIGQLGQAAQQMASAVGGSFGQLGALLGPAGPIAAGIGLTLKAAQDTLALAREAEAAVSKVGGLQAATQLELKLGAGAPERFARMGIPAGMSREESVRAAAGIAGTLDRPADVEAAFGAFAGLRRRAGMVEPGYAGAIGQLMGRGLGGTQAANLAAMGLREGMGAEQVGGMGRVLSVARTFGFDPAEALSLNQVVGDLGGDTISTVELLRNLGGDSPALAGMLRGRGLDRGPLAARLGRLGGLSAVEQAQVGGRATPFLGDLVGRGAEVAGGRGAWAAALGGADLLEGYQAGGAVRTAAVIRESQARIEETRAATGTGWVTRGKRAFDEFSAEQEERAGGVPLWLQSGLPGLVARLAGELRRGAADGARESQKQHAGM